MARGTLPTMWAMVVMLLVGPALAVVQGCTAAQTVEDQQVTIPLELDRPQNGKLDGSKLHKRYLLKVQDAGKLTIELSWTNPEALEKILVQYGSKSVQTVQATDKLKVVHEIEGAEAGFYYIELVPLRARDNYNIVVTLEK